MRRLIVIALVVLSGCAWYQEQWSTADVCATRICPNYAADNRLTCSGGQYDPEAEACACALVDPYEHGTFLHHVPYQS